MEAPKIVIDGKEIVMKEPTAKAWRTVTAKAAPESMDDFVEIVACCYQIDADKAADLPISDVVPAAYNAIQYVNELVAGKLSNIVPDAKNA